MRGNIVRLFVKGGDERRRSLVVDLEEPRFCDSSQVQRSEDTNRCAFPRISVDAVLFPPRASSQVYQSKDIICSVFLSNGVCINALVIEARCYRAQTPRGMSFFMLVSKF